MSTTRCFRSETVLYDAVSDVPETASYDTVSDLKHGVDGTYLRFNSTLVAGAAANIACVHCFAFFCLPWHVLA